MNLPAPAPEPLPPFTLPAALDGRDGANRAHDSYRQIAADTDLEAVRLWLAEYGHSPHTLRSYRKEAVRLLIWATRALGKPLSSLTREDFLLYERFLAAPAADWTDPALPRRGGARRLFDGPLSERSRRQALGILSGLFNYLVAAGYLAGNPLALRRSRASTTARQRRIERYLDHALWQIVLDSVETWPQDTPRARQHYERSRWLIRLLSHTALRASEAARAKAADFFQRRGRWWLHVTGKGGTEGEVPVADALMAEFARYRTFYGLTPTAVYLIVKKVFRRAADILEAANPIGAVTLRRASPHWLRHSAASHQADAGTDIRFIQKNLRHASIETTGLYLHAEDDRRHAQTTDAQCSTTSIDPHDARRA
ncbi:tyrosine-type recombinase/integrase [Burkholderia ubonensis]|uniref:tyrosine-type recombinase/integrase n=1 Tax=Burkholderia ubonensis TaxID=101571 RepID=UPI00075DE144|nr:tyrosine-type recombinase/integrase [Burkholderia ubonensis]KWB91751.1 integrase [Burkholderia ubonensis]